MPAILQMQRGELINRLTLVSGPFPGSYNVAAHGVSAKNQTFFWWALTYRCVSQKVCLKAIWIALDLQGECPGRKCLLPRRQI